MIHGDIFEDLFIIGIQSFLLRFLYHKIFLFRYKSAYGIIELYRNNEIIYSTDDNKTLGQTDDRDRIVCFCFRKVKIIEF